MKKRFNKIVSVIAVFVLFLGCVWLFPTTSFAKPVEMTVASTAMTGLSWFRAAEQWKAELEKSGLFKVNLKFNGILGGEREGAEAVQMGTIEGVWVSDVGLSAVVPEISYTNLPYLFSNYAQVDKYYFNGFVGKDVKEKLEKKGFKFMGFCENDFRGLTNSKKPVVKPADISGMKIRVPEVPVYLEFFKKLDTQPTPMAVTELTTALQQKTVDGQDNGILLTKTNGYYQLQKYMTLTNHIYNAGAILVNPKFFASLSKEQQDLLTKLSVKYSKVQVEMNRSDVAKFLKEIKAYGVQVSELTPEQTAAFAAVGKTCWGTAEKNFGKAWVDRLRNEIK